MKRNLNVIAATFILALFAYPAQSAPTKKPFTKEELKSFCYQYPKETKETCLSRLKKKNVLMITGKDVTPKNLIRFNDTSKISFATAITEKTDHATLGRILSLKKIKFLGISNRGDVDAILNQLKTKKIVGLTIAGVKDNELNNLPYLKSLRSLELKGPITDKALDKLKGLKELSRLFLFDSKITDPGLGKLTPLASHLKYLFIGNDRNITGKAITYLKALKLKCLGVTQTSMTPGDIAQLKRLRPKTKIKYLR